MRTNLLRRRLLQLAVSAVALPAAVAGLALSAGPASAAPVFTDGFEPPPAPQAWSFTHVGNGAGGFSTLGPRSGVQDAFITQTGAGFSSVQRTVAITPGAFCTASVFLDPAKTPAIPATEDMALEIIEPVSFTYVARDLRTMSSSATYTKFSVSWSSSPATVLVRITIGGSVVGGVAKVTALRADDFSISC
jgi:hypothetical protein